MKLAFEWLLVLLVAGFFLAGLQYLIYMHELAHQRIFTVFGVNSTISMKFLSGTTAANNTDWNLASKEDRNIMKALQAENEMFFYPLSVLLTMQACVILFLLPLRSMLRWKR